MLVQICCSCLCSLWKRLPVMMVGSGQEQKTTYFIKLQPKNHYRQFKCTLLHTAFLYFHSFPLQWTLTGNLKSLLIQIWVYRGTLLATYQWYENQKKKKNWMDLPWCMSRMAAFRVTYFIEMDQNIIANTRQYSKDGSFLFSLYGGFVLWGWYIAEGHL